MKKKALKDFFFRAKNNILQFQKIVCFYVNYLLMI